MKAFAIAIAVVFAAIALARLQRSNGDDPGPSRAEGPKIPILLVHGSGLDSSSWSALIGHLRSAGWPPEYLVAPDLVPSDGANLLAATTQLQPAAIRLMEQAAARAAQENWARPEKFAIVGHSMGTVSGRWLAAKLMPDRVAVFVAITGANHGTDALCGLAGQGNDELCPAYPTSGQSFVLEQLNGRAEAPLDETPYGPATDPPGVPAIPPTASACIAWYTIFIASDEWIVPAASARLVGAGGAELPLLPKDFDAVAPGEFRLNTRVRHDDVPASAAVIDLIRSLLSADAVCPAI